jgi:hypothetical protein
MGFLTLICKISLSRVCKDCINLSFSAIWRFECFATVASIIDVMDAAR